MNIQPNTFSATFDMRHVHWLAETQFSGAALRRIHYCYKGWRIKHFHTSCGGYIDQEEREEEKGGMLSFLGILLELVDACNVGTGD